MDLLPQSAHPASRLRPFIFIAVFVAVFHRFWDHTIIAQDSFYFFAANKHFLAESLARGVFPLWDPHLFLGLPFAAEVQAGAFYPLNFLFLVLEFGTAYRLFILCHYPLAAWAMDLFLRGRGRSSAAALLGGLAYALSGYMISQHALVRMALGAAWAPLVLYCVDRARAGRLWWAAGAGAVLSLQVLSSDPETAAMTAALALIIAAVAARQDRDYRRGPAIIALMAVFSFGLAAVQVIPTAQMIMLTSRGRGLTLDQAQVFSCHPATLLDFLWPTPFGLQWPGFHYWGRSTINASFSQVPWSASNYLGLTVMALAALGLARGPRATRLAAALGIAAFLLLALGQYTPVYGWFHALVPVFNSFRYPSKYLIGATGFIAFAAAAGFDALAAALAHSPRAALRSAAVFPAAVLIAALAGYLLWPLCLARLAPFAPDSFQYQASLAHLHRGALQVALAGTIAGAALLAAASGRLAWKRASGIIIATVIVDLARANVSIMPAGPADLYAVTPEMARAIAPAGPPLGQARIFRDYFKFPDSDPRLAHLNHYVRQTVWERDTLKRNLSALYGFEDIGGYGSYELDNGRELFQSAMSPDLMSVFNLRDIIWPGSRPPIQSVPNQTIFDDPGAGVSVLRLSDFFPRAYWVPNAAGAADDAAALAQLRSVNLKTTAVITGLEAPPPDPPGGFSLTPARILSYSPNRVEIEIAAPAAGWLVLSDRYYPGWKALLDGVPAEVRLANVAVRAVRIDAPGTHRAVFFFRPGVIVIGAGISGAAALVFIGWALAPGLLRRVRRRSSV